MGGGGEGGGGMALEGLLRGKGLHALQLDQAQPALETAWAEERVGKGTALVGTIGING